MKGKEPTGPAEAREMKGEERVGEEGGKSGNVHVPMLSTSQWPMPTHKKNHMTDII